MLNKILIAGVTALITAMVAVSLYRHYDSSCTLIAQGTEMKPIDRTNEGSGAVTQPEDSPFACDMTALDAKGRERHAVVTRQLNDGIQEVRELPDGYALRFTPSQESILLVSEFIAREKLCCPFFSFDLMVEKEGGPVWLQLRGREGVKAFIQAELKW
jgi:hypothetical protein